MINYHKCSVLTQCKCKFITLQFWRSKVQNGSHWPKMKVFVGLCSFLEALGYNLFSCLFQILETTCTSSSPSYVSKTNRDQVFKDGSFPLSCLPREPKGIHLFCLLRVPLGKSHKIVGALMLGCPWSFQISGLSRLSLQQVIDYSSHFSTRYRWFPLLMTLQGKILNPVGARTK